MKEKNINGSIPKKKYLTGTSTILTYLLYKTETGPSQTLFTIQ